ncbi:MAG: asparagine synthase [Alphaproteobacteria bacterium]|nr:asparagine synthase [Alphaproteobacteria bacterium]
MTPSPATGADRRAHGSDARCSAAMRRRRSPASSRLPNGSGWRGSDRAARQASGCGLRKSTPASPPPRRSRPMSASSRCSTRLIVSCPEPSETHPDLDRVAAENDWSVLEQASFLDLMHYLPDDILVKVDRAAMAHSLETRIPFLDPAVVRFALSLPDEIRTLGGTRKGILKAVLDRYVPASLWDRPKRGFGIPGAAWLKGPLKPLAEDLFQPKRWRVPTCSTWRWCGCSGTISVPATSAAPTSSGRCSSFNLHLTRHADR